MSRITKNLNVFNELDVTGATLKGFTDNTGELLVGQGNILQKLPIDTDGKFLRLNSAALYGVEWSDISVITNEVTTTDNTPTQIVSISTDNNTTNYFRFEIVAFSSTSNEGYGVVFNKFYKNIAGTVTDMNLIDNLLVFDNINWNVTFNIVGANINVNVIGENAKTILWKLQIK